MWEADDTRISDTQSMDYEIECLHSFTTYCIRITVTKDMESSFQEKINALDNEVGKVKNHMFPVGLILHKTSSRDN